MTHKFQLGKAQRLLYFSPASSLWGGGAEKVAFRDEIHKITKGAVSSVLSLNKYGNNGEKLTKFLLLLINK